MKYIDADKLKSEIEKRLKNIRDYMRGTGMRYKGPKYFKAQGKESAYDALLNVLDSLQQEQPEVDLEKEIEKVCKDFVFPLYGLDDEYGRKLINIIVRHFAEWGADHLRDSTKMVDKDLEEAAKNYTDSSEWLIGENLEHIDAAFIAGALWQKEQMMKEAVDGTVHHYAAVHYVSVDEVQLTERLKQFQDGDKVKLLIN